MNSAAEAYMELPLIDRLRGIDDELAEMVSDEMTKCDERGERTPGHAFTVAEEAAPELDAARTHIQEAIECLEDWEL